MSGFDLWHAMMRASYGLRPVDIPTARAVWGGGWFSVDGFWLGPRAEVWSDWA